MQEPIMTEKVVCYILRDRMLLVFRHRDYSYEQVGIQVPAGTVRPGEPPEVAAVREAREETRLRDYRVVAKLGEAHYDLVPHRPETQHRHFFQLELAGPAPQRWNSQEDHDGQNEPTRFECFWIPVESGHILQSGQGALLGRLTATPNTKTRPAAAKPTVAKSPDTLRRRRLVVIRAANSEDIPDAVRLKADVAEERRWIGAEPPVDTDTTAAGLRDLLDGSSGGVFVADHHTDGIIATGTVAFLYPGVVSITMMVVRAHRGQGIGTAVLDALIEWADTHHAHKITLEVWPHNTAAIGLYKQAGFHIEGTLRAHYRRGNGELWDAVIISRLAPAKAL